MDTILQHKLRKTLYLALQDLAPEAAKQYKQQLDLSEASFIATEVIVNQYGGNSAAIKLIEAISLMDHSFLQS